MRKFATFGLAAIVLATWASDASAFGFRKKKKDQCSPVPVQHVSACCGSTGMYGNYHGGTMQGGTHYGTTGHNSYWMGTPGTTYYAPSYSYPSNPIFGGQYIMPAGGQTLPGSGGTTIVPAGGVPTPMPSSR